MYESGRDAGVSWAQQCVCACRMCASPRGRGLEVVWLVVIASGLVVVLVCACEATGRLPHSVKSVKGLDRNEKVWLWMSYGMGRDSPLTSAERLWYNMCHQARRGVGLTKHTQE